MPTLSLIDSRYWKHCPVIELIINYHPHKFMIDTGASHTIITPRLIPDMTELQLRLVDYGVSNGVGGNMKTSVLPVRFNFLGKFITQVRLLPHNAINFIDEHNLSGLIGQDLLSQFEEVIINYKKSTIKFVG